MLDINRIEIPQSQEARVLLFNQIEQIVLKEHVDARMSDAYARKRAAEARASVEARAANEDAEREIDARVRAQEREASKETSRVRQELVANESANVSAMRDSLAAFVREVEKYAATKGNSDFNQYVDVLTAVLREAGFARLPAMLAALNRSM